MNPRRRSIFALSASPRAKWVVFAIWVIGILIAAGPANLPGKFSDAENNESTSFLPGDASGFRLLVGNRKEGLEIVDSLIEPIMPRGRYQILERHGAERCIPKKGQFLFGGVQLRATVIVNLASLRLRPLDHEADGHASLDTKHIMFCT